MRSSITALFKADLKHFTPPFMKAYLIKNLVFFTIFLMVFIPFMRREDSPVRGHDPTEEMYVYDQYPHVENIDEDYEYFEIEFEDEGPQRSMETKGEAKGPLTQGAGFLGFGVIAVLLINLIIAHCTVFLVPMKKGYGRAVTRLGVSTGDLLRSRMFGVGAIFISISLFDIMIASIIAQMAAGWFFEIFVTSIITLAVIICIYALSFGIQILIKIPNKRRLMFPLGYFTIMTIVLFMITQNAVNLISWFFDDMLGTGTTSGAGTPLMYLSPFHTLGEIYDWAIYGTEISFLSFIWIPIFAGLIYWGFRSMKKLEYQELLLMPGHPYLP